MNTTKDLTNATALKYHYCNGAVIGDKFVLTTASCLQNKKPQNVSIWVGGFTSLEKGFKVDVIHLQQHPNYSPSKGNETVNNVGLVVIPSLSGSTVTEKLTPSQLPKKAVSQGDKLRVVGWFTLKYNGETIYHKALRKFDMRVIPKSTCEIFFQDRVGMKTELYQNYTTCTVTFDETKDGCVGKDGGPVYNSKGEIAGLVTEKYCSLNRPDIFISVHHYTKWIEDTMKQLNNSVPETVTIAKSAPETPNNSKPEIVTIAKSAPETPTEINSGNTESVSDTQINSETAEPKTDTQVDSKLLDLNS